MDKRAQEIAAVRTLPFLDLALSEAGRDERLLPVRADVAAAELEGIVPAPRYVASESRQVIRSVTRLYPAPGAEGRILSELLTGEIFHVYGEAEGWAWGQCATDGYVGYLESSALSVGGGEVPTHRVAQPSTLVYPEANLKCTPVDWLPFGSRISLGEAGKDSRFARAGDLGWVVAAHCRPLAEREADPVSAARRFMDAPYLWGGRTVRGLDCSALVQLAFDAAGVVLPRDTDQQERWTAGDIGPDGPFKRGDIVFFKGHVGIMEDGETLLHANAHHMAVVSEPLRDLVGRLGGPAAEPVTSVARIPFDGKA